MKYYLGIDPGLTGALAYYAPADGSLQIWDMPIHEIKMGGKKKRKIDIVTLANIVDNMSEQTILAVVEEVGAMPKQGVTSSFNFGFSAGCAQMVVAANFIPLRTIRPNIWKRHMGLTGDKTASRREASRLLPQHNGMWPLVKHDGRAEAALLARYIAKLYPKKEGEYDYV